MGRNLLFIIFGTATFPFLVFHDAIVSRFDLQSHKQCGLEHAFALICSVLGTVILFFVSLALLLIFGWASVFFRISSAYTILYALSLVCVGREEKKC